MAGSRKGVSSGRWEARKEVRSPDGDDDFDDFDDLTIITMMMMIMMIIMMIMMMMVGMQGHRAPDIPSPQSEALVQRCRGQEPALYGDPAHIQDWCQ